MVEVTLRIKGRKSVSHLMGGGGDGGARSKTLLELMAGLVPVRNSQTDSDPHLSSVVVASVAEGGAAAKAGRDKVRPGDVVRLVDGHQVNLATVEQLLSTYTSSSAKVKLTLQRPSPAAAAAAAAAAATVPLRLTNTDSSSSGQEEVSAITNMTEDEADQTPPPPPSSLFVSTPPRLARLLLGEGAEHEAATADASREVKALLRRMPYLALGVTRTGVEESSPEMADVLYQFPPARSAGACSEALIKARGVFVTLCQVNTIISFVN